MHLLDTNSDTAHTRRQFLTVLALVSGTTYLIAVAALLGVNQRRTLREWSKKLFKYGAEFPQSAKRAVHTSFKSFVPASIRGQGKEKQNDEERVKGGERAERENPNDK